MYDIHCTTYIARHTHKYRGCDLEVSVNTSELRRSVHTCSQCIQPCDRTFIIRWWIRNDSQKKKRVDETTPKKKKKKLVYPYGSWAAKYADHFKDVPTTEFATTLAALYPFLAEPKYEHEELRKTPNYPMTAVWPVAILFVRKCESHMKDVFKDYESAGGQYYGVEPGPSSSDDENPIVVKQTQTVNYDKVF